MTEFGRYRAIRTTLSSQTITGEAVCVKSGNVGHQHGAGRLRDIQITCARSDSVIRPAQAVAASVLDSGVIRSSMVQCTGLEGGMPSGSIWLNILGGYSSPLSTIGHQWIQSRLLPARLRSRHNTSIGLS